MSWREDIDKLSNNKLVDILKGMSGELGGNTTQAGYIPLGGTEVDKPITGDLQIELGKMIFGKDSRNTRSFVSLNLNGVRLGHLLPNAGNTASSYLDLRDDGLIYTNSNVLSKGIVGSRNYYASFRMNSTDDDNAYVQFGLVKKFFAPLTGEGATGNWKITSSNAKKLETARKIKLVGSVTGEANFDGSSDIEINTNSSVSISDASATTKGIIKLAGDLTGTADIVSIRDNAVTSSKLANDSITTSKIKNNSVTIDKLPSGATNSGFLRGDGVWVNIPAPINYTAGMGITITGNVISNSAPNINQNLSYSNGTLSISGGNSVVIPQGKTYTAGTGISIDPNGVISNSAPNTNQSLSIVGTSLTISGGNTITLPQRDDQQSLTLGGDGVLELSGTTPSRVSLTHKVEKGATATLHKIPMVENVDSVTGIIRLGESGLRYNQTSTNIKSIHSSYNIYAPAFYEHSLGQNKTNIKYFKKSGLELVNKLKIVTFDRKDDPNNVNKIGIIINNAPEEFASKEKDAVDLYKTIFVMAKAIQELSSEVKELKEKLNGGA